MQKTNSEGGHALFNESIKNLNRNKNHLNEDRNKKHLSVFFYTVVCRLDRYYNLTKYSSSRAFLELLLYTTKPVYFTKIASFILY